MLILLPVLTMIRTYTTTVDLRQSGRRGGYLFVGIVSEC